MRNRHLTSSIAAVAVFGLSTGVTKSDDYDVTISGQLAHVLPTLGDTAGLDGAQVQLVATLTGCAPMLYVNGYASALSTAHSITITGSIGGAFDGSYTASKEIALVPNGILGDPMRGAFVADSGIEGIDFGPGLSMTVFGPGASPAAANGQIVDGPFLDGISVNGGGLTSGDQTYEFSSLSLSYVTVPGPCEPGGSGDPFPGATYGTEGDDTIIAQAGGDTIVGLGGNDVITGTGAADVYVYYFGDGNDTISDYSTSGTVDRLIFPDLNAGDVSFAHLSNEDMTITMSNGEVITIIDQARNTKYGVEEIEFADGTILDRQAIRDKAVADMKSTGAVRGTGLVENYSHTLGDGSYTLYDYSTSGAVDRLTMVGLNAGDVSFAHLSNEDMTITMSNGEVITIIDQARNTKYGVEEIEFADGTILDRQAIRDKAVADMKSTGAVRGTGLVENYSHTLGDGSYTLYDYANSGTVNVDRLTFVDQLAGDVTIAHLANDDMTLTLSNGEVITVIDQDRGGKWGLEEIEFSDGAVLVRANF